MIKKKSISFAKQKYTALKDGFFVVINSFLNSKTVKAFAAKYPKVYTFIIERFSLDAFVGLPLTFLIISFVANLLLLDELVDAFLENPVIIATDQLFAKFMFSIRLHWLAKIFYYFSLFGSLYGVVFIAIISIIFFVVKKNKSYIFPVLISLLGTQFTVQMSKNYFHRIRPIDYSFYQEISYSFPSGHATVSVAFYGVLFYAVIRSRVSYTAKFRWMIAAILFIGLLGFSRLYMCVHYLSDVMAGYSLGLLWMLLAISIREWLIHRKKIKLQT